MCVICQHHSSWLSVGLMRFVVAASPTQGAAPPPTHFDAGGYNDSFYAWKAGGDGSGYWNGGRNRAYCNDYIAGGGSPETGDTSCRPHDPSYNEVCITSIVATGLCLCCHLCVCACPLR